MMLLTKEITEKLLKNGRESQAAIEKDGNTPKHFPVVKLFTPDAGATWLLSELDPIDNDTAFGLCDLGLGFPELGYVSITELKSIRGRFGLPVERDKFFTAKKTLSEYAKDANEKGRIEAY